MGRGVGVSGEIEKDRNRKREKTKQETLGTYGFPNGSAFSPAPPRCLKGALNRPLPDVLCDT